MDIKVQSILLMVLGTAIFAICLLADFIGLGANTVVIGWKQYFGASIGVALFLFGLHLAIHHVLGQK
jgi:hypothetical protein